MQRMTVTTAASVGLVARHNISDVHGQRLIAKGRVITVHDALLLDAHGIAQIEVVKYDPDDIDEHRAAAIVASCASTTGVTLKPPHHGRTDVHATYDGLWLVDDAALAAWHTIVGVTIATRRGGCVVVRGQRVATIKILPFALPQDAFVAVPAPALRVARYVASHVAVIIVGDGAVWDRLARTHLAALWQRLRHYPVLAVSLAHVYADEGAVTQQLRTFAHHDIIITLTETSIMDPSDVVPSSIQAAGGVITCYGAPVEPGNLLLMGQIGTTIVLGAPGCIRGMAKNVVDLVLPRIFARVPTSAADIYAFANGGLLGTEEQG